MSKHRLMEALLWTKPGDPTVPIGDSESSPMTLSKTHPIPRVESPTSVRIRIRAASVNFGTLMVIRGDHEEAMPSLGKIPASDYSGTVDVVGPSVTKFKVGDRVCSYATAGAFAEFIVADESELFLVPNGVDMVAAGALTGVYGTSHIALVHRAQLRARQVLLVLGAAGGVGTAATQIGKIRDAIVIAVVRGDEKVKYMETMGVDHVVDTSKENILEGVTKFLESKSLEGVDVLFDPVGGKVCEDCLPLLNRGAGICIIGFASGQEPVISAKYALAQNWTIHGIFFGSYKTYWPRALEDSMEELLSWLSKGLITINISKTYKLSQAHLAFSALKDRKVMGKVVIVFDDGDNGI